MADQEKDQKDQGDEPKTRTRSTASDKEQAKTTEQSAADQRKAEAKARADEKAARDKEAKDKREAERKERQERQERERAEREAKRKAEKEAKEKEKEEAKAAKEEAKVKERQDKIDRGEIIFATHDGDVVPASEANGDFNGVTYVLTEPKKEEVANRARSVIKDLIEGATEVPMPGKELADEYGGGTVQWVAFYGMLRVLGYIRPYRFRTGERGESGLAYLWIGPTDDEFVNALSNEVNAPAEAEDVDEAVAA